MRLFLAIFFVWGILAGQGPEMPGSSPAPTSLTPYQFQEGSEMTVHGSSNVRDWTMDVREIRGEIDLEAAEEGAPTINQLRVEVPVEQIVASQGSMQDKAHKALKKNAYPIIYFQSETVDVTEAGDNSFTAVATGELIIAGERKTVELEATGTRQENGTFRLEGEHALTLSEFGVERPTAMLGALRVSDGVRVTFSTIVAPK